MHTEACQSIAVEGKGERERERERERGVITNFKPLSYMDMNT